MPRHKIAFLTSHPIQYQAPFFRKLVRTPEIDFTVYFYSEFGMKGEIDPEFQIPVKWDIPLLEGYPYKFLRNYSPFDDPRKFWGCFNPSLIYEISLKRLDAVVVHGYAAISSWLAFGAASLKRVPIILHGETILNQNPNKRFRFLKKTALSLLFSKVNAFLYIGTRSYEFYKFYGIPDQKLYLSPYSVDNDYFSAQSKMWKPRKSELKAELGIPDKKPVILCVSKLIPRKRPFDLLQAFELLDGRGSLVFVGDGELRVPLEQYVRRKQIKQVFFAGFKNQSEIGKYYSLADVFVLPSEFETWGLVVNEAMCFGLPVIAANAVASSRDLIREGENGFIYSSGDIRRLKECLKIMIDSEDTRKKMGQRSLEIISSWNYDRCITGILQAINTISH